MGVDLAGHLEVTTEGCLHGGDNCNLASNHEGAAGHHEPNRLADGVEEGGV